MAEPGDEISLADSEPHQDPAEPADQQPLLAPTATPLERSSNDTADSLRSAEEGVGVKGRTLCVHVYSIVNAQGHETKICAHRLKALLGLSDSSSSSMSFDWSYQVPEIIKSCKSGNSQPTSLLLKYK